MGEAGDGSSLNSLFKRDSRRHSFVDFGNDIVFTLSYLIVILKGEARASWGAINRFPTALLRCFREWHRFYS